MYFLRDIQKIVSTIAIACVLLPVSASAQNSRFQKLREWSDPSGKFKIEAELVSAANDKVILRNQAGKERAIPINMLCESDQAWIAKFQESLLSKLKLDLRKCIFASDALKLIQQFEKGGFVTDENAVFVQGKKSVYEKHASNSAIILGNQFVTRSELPLLKRNSKELVDEWIQQSAAARTGKDQKILRQATREDPSSIEADIVAALHYDIKIANFENAQRLLKSAVERGERYQPIASRVDTDNLIVALNNLAVSCVRENKVSRANRLWQKAYEITNGQLPSAATHNIAKVCRMIKDERSGISVERAAVLQFDRLATMARASGSAGGWRVMLPKDSDGAFRSDVGFVIQDRAAQIMGEKEINDTRCVRCAGGTVLRCPQSVCDNGSVERPVIGNRTKTFPDGTVVNLGRGRIGTERIRCNTCRGAGTVRCPYCSAGRQNN